MANSQPLLFFLLSVLFLLHSPNVHGRQISDGIISDSLPSLGNGECEQTYGFLPCSTTVMGNLFLLLVYGYLMFLAATFLLSGSEILLEILGPGVVGGLLLTILGALPDAILILVSGLSGNKETAQEQVLIGMGLLSGSTVMLLTILWGSCVVVGKCDLSEDQNQTTIDSQDTKTFSLFGSAVSTDVQTSYAARIMVISIIPFIIAQIPKIFKISSGDRWAVFIALLFSVALLLAYCVYQIYQPWIQSRRIAYSKHKHVLSGFLKHVHNEVFGRLLNDDGSPNTPVIEKLFERIDVNSDNEISHQELAALIIGMQFDEMDLNMKDATQKIMDEFDTSGDNAIDKQEFVRGISKWLNVAKGAISHADFRSTDLLKDFHDITREEHVQLIDRGEEAVLSIANPIWITLKSLLFLLIGTAIAIAFADPLVDAVNSFSSVTNIPPFFISFIAMPLATNSSEAVSAVIFASRKKQRTASLTFSEIYGAVTMNNTLCLAVFLSLVYVRGLAWDFSAEVLVILIVSVLMGIFASFRTTFPLWTSSVAFILYPISLLLVYVFDYVFGWS